ncbi:MAG: nicotinamide-nucleotide amidase [Gammaproteobacteria bacterium]|nr:nicotinamide-nucleotide amidase [Gammaproteobacteria bacterium]
MTHPDISIIVEQLAELLLKQQEKIAVAESCTGGWIAKVLTDLSGSSEWFDRGFVTYSNKAKHEMLGVADSTLQHYGAVSQQTVQEMALGVLNNSDADYSLSISGIAGPGGGTKEKPVGLVWFAWAVNENNANKILNAKEKIFAGDRNAVREQAVFFALNELVEFIKLK